jgi:hypothetical protein
MRDGATVHNYTGKNGGATSHNTGYTATALRASTQILLRRTSYSPKTLSEIAFNI